MSLKKNTLLALGLGGLSLGLQTVVHAVELESEPKLQAIADELIAEQYYTQAELEAIFDKATVQQSVLDAMKSPAEYKFTWGKYRKLFLKQDRIQQGVEFWNEYETELSRAEKEYGVPAHVIVSIVGVESKFGRYKGKHKVLDSLVSLTVGYPRRSKFFASELKEFLILTKENGLPVDQILGSYAGAVGYPQFISSSYRNYAVDFSGDGKTDLINQPIDAIGSIANYFIENGWKPGQAVTSLAHETVEVGVADLANRKRKTLYTAAALREKGAPISTAVDDAERLNVLMLNASEVLPESRDNSVYIVRAGDTACAIAETNSVSCKALFKLNKLNKKGDIFRGQKLKLPQTKMTSAKASKAKGQRPNVVEGSKWAVSNPKIAASAKGITPESERDSSIKERFFFTHHNFYAITQYNHSVLYAMAVYDLSEAIANAKADFDKKAVNN